MTVDSESAKVNLITADHASEKEIDMGKMIVGPDQPPVGYFVAGAFDAPMASVEIHGDKWCVLGNNRFSDLMNDSLVYSKLQVFGFSLEK